MEKNVSVVYEKVDKLIHKVLKDTNLVVGESQVIECLGYLKKLTVDVIAEVLLSHFCSPQHRKGV